jgi:hypothetical protein
MVINRADLIEMGNIRDRRTFYDNQLAVMQNERFSFESHWQNLNDYILSRRIRFFVEDVNRGERRNLNIIDGTGTRAAGNLAAGMMGGLTSPARIWWRLMTPFPELNEQQDVKEWLQTVTRRMAQVFAKSNIYNALPIMYKEMSTFATSAMLIEEDLEHTIRAYPLPIGSYYISNNERLKVDWFMREFRMTVRQLIEKFGERDADGNVIWDNFSDKVRREWEQKRPDTWIDVVHVIHPNWYYNEKKIGARGKKFLSVYYERGTAQEKSHTSASINDTSFLRERGYDFFPVLVGRWETTGEDAYGTECPGMSALGDIKELQHDRKKLMQAIDKVVSPPTKAPSHYRKIKTSVLPGAVTYGDQRHGSNGFEAVYQIDPRFNEMHQIIQELRQMIKDAYFERLFLLLAFTDRREMTATEVQEKIREKMVILGPVIEGISQDILDPLIDITFNFMRRQGLIPPPPEILQGMELRIEYISIMAQAQKAAGLSSLDRFGFFIGNVAQYAPEVLDKVNADQYVDEYADTLGIPVGIVYPDDVVAEIREARAAAEARQQMTERLAQAASAAKDLGAAPTTGNNALADLINASRAGEAVPPPAEGAA